ncbi:MAG: rhomboid family intramembrane serine protease [Candidatus Nanohaloarchaea archaeon]|nr:rhomboid family intramembrane serine protease [Candidatus Nanohaloarchaea archaeon]
MGDVRYSSLVISAGVVAVYFLQLSLPAVNGLAFVASDFLQEPWTILTSIFLHSPGDYMHLLNNLFFLAVFGFMLENIVGTRKFLVLFFSSGMFANLSAFIFYPYSPVLGASGAISGIIAALAAIKPRTVGLLWGVPVPMWAAFLGWAAFNTLGGLATGGSTAFEAHLFGLFYGLLWGLFIREKHSGGSERSDPEPDLDLEEWEEKYMG